MEEKNETAQEVAVQPTTTQQTTAQPSTTQPTTAGAPKVEVDFIDNSAEEVLSTIAKVIFIVGIIVTVICVFTLWFVQDPSTQMTIFNPAGFATTLEVLACTLITWAGLRVFVNISKTLKEINRKIK